ncbi:hypothetical protein CDL15_Pgr012668 [Punica granatum]|uniref:Uncharacterized protein n=1 Tax=Punica granatum TaxID=22663 RepID=A0A218W6C1_PUNGR|nr:hypothetical protein CDL15_Pgr012668 [Punica granatum]
MPVLNIVELSSHFLADPWGPSVSQNGVLTAGLNNFTAGGAKAESPPMLVFLHLNGAIDPLLARPKAGVGFVVVAQKDFPYHAIGVGQSNLSVIPNDGDGLEGMEG